LHSEELTFALAAIDPSKARVFRTMGMTSPHGAPREIESLYSDAHKLYARLAAPRGMYKVVSKDDFHGIYTGEGKNAAVTPLEPAYQDASLLAVYVFTLGDDIDCRLERLMKENEYPLGFMLNAIASESADKVSGVAETKLNEQISTPPGEDPHGAVQPRLLRMAPHGAAQALRLSASGAHRRHPERRVHDDAREVCLRRPRRGESLTPSTRAGFRLLRGVSNPDVRIRRGSTPRSNALSRPRSGMTLLQGFSPAAVQRRRIRDGGRQRGSVSYSGRQ
jgi:hypothetical protein